MKRKLRIYGLLTLGTAMAAAHVIGQVFFAATPFGGTEGLLALYGETAAIGIGLAMLRVLEGEREPAKDKMPAEGKRGWRVGPVLPSYDISRT
jgi:hypothetical protein